MADLHFLDDMSTDRRATLMVRGRGDPPPPPAQPPPATQPQHSPSKSHPSQANPSKAKGSHATPATPIQQSNPSTVLAQSERTPEGAAPIYIYRFRNRAAAAVLKLFCAVASGPAGDAGGVQAAAAHDAAGAPDPPGRLRPDHRPDLRQEGDDCAGAAARAVPMPHAVIDEPSMAARCRCCMNGMSGRLARTFSCSTSAGRSPQAERAANANPPELFAQLATRSVQTVLNPKEPA